jgi:hypothetical protein
LLIVIAVVWGWYGTLFWRGFAKVSLLVSTKSPKMKSGFSGSPRGEEWAI